MVGTGEDWSGAHMQGVTLCLHSKRSLPGLLPNGVYLLLDLGNFLLVATSFVVRDLSFELGNLLGVLPVGGDCGKRGDV